MIDDLRQAIRMCRTAPGFAALAILLLTLGTASLTTVLSVVDPILLRRLPFDRADRLLTIAESQKESATPGLVAYPNFLEWRKRDDLFTAAGASFLTSARLQGQADAEADAVAAVQASAGLLEALGLAPALGRTFTAADELAGAERVAILSDGLWRRRFGADPSIVGRSVTINNRPVQIVGVLPARFDYPVGREKPTEILLSPDLQPDERTLNSHGRINRWSVVARTRDGVTTERARAEIDALTQALWVQSGSLGRDRRTWVLSLSDSLFGRVRPWMLALLTAAGLLLLMATVNVANLLLARALQRQGDIAVRLALGATRWRIVRSLAVESLLLVGIATAAGLFLASWATTIVRASLPALIPRADRIGLDLRVFAMSAACAVLASLAFGLLPAWRTTRPVLSQVLADGARSSMAPGRRSLANGLMVGQIALAATLLVGAALFLGSFVRVMNVDLGLDREGVLSFQARVPASSGSVAERIAGAHRAVEDILDRVRSMPGVTSAALLQNGLPMSGGGARYSVEVVGRDGMFGGDDTASGHFVTPDYFKTLRIALLRGRAFDSTDRLESPRVAILNEEAARRYFSGRDPVGEKVRTGPGENTVVGIVANVRLGGPEDHIRPEVYWPFAQGSSTAADVVARVAGSPAGAIAALAGLAPLLYDGKPPVVKTLDESFARLTAERRFNSALMTTLGALALLIAAIGVYGMMAAVSVQRTQEIAVRMALGATPAAIRGMLLRQAGLLVACGSGIGAVLAWMLSRLVAAALFAIEPHDAVVFTAAIALTLIAGIAAGLMPALRASRLDPIAALRR